MKITRVALAGAMALAVIPLSGVGQLNLQSGIVELGDVRLHYRYGGEGQALLFVHGFSNVGQVWDRFAAPLAENRSVIIPDLRGHGLSTNPSGEFTHRLAAEDLLGLLDRLAIEQVVGIGHSSGAIALLDLALMAPGRLEALLLVDGAHRFPEATREILRGVDADAMTTALPHFFDAIVRRHQRGMNQLRELAAQIRAVGDDPTEGVHSQTDLKALQVPTLIVHGDRDDVYPVSLATELFALLPHAELWVMPGVDHGAFIGSQFDPAEERCVPCSAAGHDFPLIVDRFLSSIR